MSVRRPPLARRYRRSATAQLRLQSQLLEYAGQAIVATDLAGHVTYANPAANALFGYAPGEMLGRTLIERHSVDIALSHEVMSRIYAGEPFKGEWLIRRSDGLLIPVYSNATLYRDPAGRPLGVIAAITDVSDYNRVEAALRESEARYRHVVEMQGEMVCRYNPDGCRLTFVNEAYCRTFGRSCEELIGTSYLDFIPAQSREMVAARAAAFTTDQPVRMIELLATVASGELRWQQWSDRAIFDEQGRVVDVICVGRDITDRVRVEAELRQLNDTLERRVATRTAELSASNMELQAVIAERDSSARDLAAANHQLADLNHDLAVSRNLLGSVFDSLSDALALVSPAGLVLIGNQALGALLGLSPVALVDRPWSSLGLPGTAEIARVAVTGAVCKTRVQFEASGASAVVFDLQAIPLSQSSGGGIGIVVRMSDVTEQVQVEALAIANERLAANGRLAAIVAHEINTPLQAIENLLFLAERDDAPGDSYRPLVRDEIRRVGAILRRLLNLTQPDAGPSGTIDCAMVIDRVLLLTSTSCARLGIVVIRALPPALPAVPGDADQLTQVLLNLVVNAIDALPTGGQLRISVEQQDQVLCICVADSGAGVAPELRERIFEPFVTTKPGGSGLGLAVVRRIVGQHGGTITVEGEPGQGARFVITLPLGSAAPNRLEDGRLN